jgi:hypothetical protein
MWEAGWGSFACFTCFASCVFQYRYILYRSTMHVRLSPQIYAAPALKARERLTLHTQGGNALTAVVGSHCMRVVPYRSTPQPHPQMLCSNDQINRSDVQGALRCVDRRLPVITGRRIMRYQ